MEPDQIARTYGRYIGAGAVATGGILSMLNALPLIIASEAPPVARKPEPAKMMIKIEGLDGGTREVPFKQP